MEHKQGVFEEKNSGFVNHYNFIESPICMGRERVKEPKHPTQKPVKILEHLLKLGSKEGDLVFDPFMGVGSTGVAALNMRRRFLGFDKEPSYVLASVPRLENASGRRAVWIADHKDPAIDLSQTVDSDFVRGQFQLAA